MRDSLNLAEHVQTINGQFIEFFTSPTVVETLDARRIFVRIGGVDGPAPGARLRFPMDLLIEPYTTFYCPPLLCVIGAFSYMGSVANPGMRIGRYCAIASGMQVFGDRHPLEWATISPVVYSMDVPRFDAHAAAHIDFDNDMFVRSEYPQRVGAMPVIENDVWIGQNVQLAQNVTIGTGAVVAACSVVTKNVAPYMIVGGNPARVIRPRFPEKLIEKFLASKWWEYDVRPFLSCDYKNPEKFIEEFAEWKQTSGVSPYKPNKVGCRDILGDLILRYRGDLPTETL